MIDDLVLDYIVMGELLVKMSELIFSYEFLIEVCGIWWFVY